MTRAESKIVLQFIELASSWLDISGNVLKEPRPSGYVERHHYAQRQDKALLVRHCADKVIAICKEYKG
jgi:hypothetical protein